MRRVRVNPQTGALLVCNQDNTSLLGAKYNATPPNYQSGQSTTLQTNEKGELKVIIAGGIPFDGDGNIGVSLASTLNNNLDSVAAYLATDAIMFNKTVSLTPYYDKISASSSGNTTIVSAVTNKKIRVLSYVIQASAAVNIKFRSGSSDITGTLYCAANSIISVPFSPVGYFETSMGSSLSINLSDDVAIGGHLTYVTIGV